MIQDVGSSTTTHVLLNISKNGPEKPNLNRKKTINNNLFRIELLNCLEWDLGPEDILQKDILPNLPPTGGYDPIITPIIVFFTLFVCLSGGPYHCNVSGGRSNNGHLIQTHIPSINNNNLGANSMTK